MAPDEVVDAEVLPPPALSPAEASTVQAAETAEGAITLDLSKAEAEGVEKGRRRLLPSEIRVILDLHAKGLSQNAIARRLNISQSTVAYWLSGFDDTRPLAKARLRAGALELAERVIERANPEEAIKALQGMDVIEGKKSGDGGVKVIIGVQLKTG